MKKIGITGTIASGKTSVSILLRRRGMQVFNSDKYGAMATHAGNPCFTKITDAFGTGLIAEDGDIDRRKLASIVFNNEEKRKLLNSIVHPYVREGLEKFIARQEGGFCFAEVPLLYEAGFEDLFDEICVVTCSKETAVKRMMEDREYTEDEALGRYNSQIDPEIQIARADKVIYNDGTLADLDHEINLWIRDLRKETRHGNQAG